MATAPAVLWRVWTERPGRWRARTRTCAASPPRPGGVCGAVSAVGRGRSSVVSSSLESLKLSEPADEADLSVCDGLEPTEDDVARALTPTVPVTAAVFRRCGTGAEVSRSRIFSLYTSMGGSAAAASRCHMPHEQEGEKWRRTPRSSVRAVSSDTAGKRAHMRSVLCAPELLVLCCADHTLEGAWDDAESLRRAATKHRIRLARARLAVRKDAHLRQMDTRNRVAARARAGGRNSDCGAATVRACTPAPRPTCMLCMCMLCMCRRLREPCAHRSPT
jgi:hypothetical protein